EEARYDRDQIEGDFLGPRNEIRGPDEEDGRDQDEQGEVHTFPLARACRGRPFSALPLPIRPGIGWPSPVGSRSMRVIHDRKSDPPASLQPARTSSPWVAGERAPKDPVIAHS